MAAIAALLSQLCLHPSYGASAHAEHPEFLVQNWSAGEGVPENSALAVAQTPEGYLWVASSGGLLRFNGTEFGKMSRPSGIKQLDTVVQSLTVDRSGRLWVSTITGLAVCERGKWGLVGGESVIARSVGEAPDGETFVGTFEGKLLRIADGAALAVTNAPKLAPSGVFLVSDARTKALWLANRFFVGQWTKSGWKAMGPQPNSRSSLVATSARGGGLWVYFGEQLRWYRPDGSSETSTAPVIDQPRELLEDSSGAIWVASASKGLTRWRPGSDKVIFLNSGTSPVPDAVRCLVQDSEGNLWAGTSSSGLYRLRPRRFENVGVQDGLTEQIAKTVIEEAPGRMLVGTHGWGWARVEEGRVTWLGPSKNAPGSFAWTALRDSRGRLWTGTFNNGLTLTENGNAKPFPLPTELGTSVGTLLEDSRGRVWVGASGGLAVIEDRSARTWPTGNGLTNFNVRSIVEHPRGEALWVGTYGHGLWRINLREPGRAERVEGLPRKRITALSVDGDGCIWAGVFGEGLFQIRNFLPKQVGPKDGLPAATVGSILEDGRGWMWMGTDRGVVRVPVDALHAFLRNGSEPPRFAVFDRTDGMAIQECTEGLQPTAARDSTGKFWFATLRGVVRADPAGLALNERAPPVVIERFAFTDRFGSNHLFLSPPRDGFAVPPGSTDLEFSYAALSYAAPEKVLYSYQLEGAEGHQVQAARRRVAAFHALSPGTYRLRVTAANNDGLWNTQGASLAFSVQPFVWQTVWFRTLALTGLAAGVGLGGWRVARARFRGQIARLEQQRALEHERARLAAVMEGTTDLVAFANSAGTVLHLNAAGIRMLQLDQGEDASLHLKNLFSETGRLQLETEAIPAACQKGAWQGESTLRQRDGKELPVSQVVIAHKDPAGQITSISIVARDISGQKLAEEEREKLQAQLAQARKMESVGRLAGGVAHDFNNMLQVILSNVELALMDVPRGSPLHADLMEIRRSAERSASLTRQLLAFARKQPVSPRVLDLNETVGGMLKMLERLIGESIRLEWVPGKDLWPVRMDPAQVDQILANLAVNARDAITGEGKLTVQTANVVFSEADGRRPKDCPAGEYVELMVMDNGQGMPPDVLDHLFEPFFTTKGVGQGTGLGLATVFGIVKQNGGTVAVESQLNQGTTFRIYLPRCRSQASAEETKPPSLRGGTETVLLVEDEPQILQLARRALEGQGYTVLAASLPGAALDLARGYSGRIDLLISDIVMPGMNGKDLRQQLEPICPQMKCLFMSGYTADIIARHGDVNPGEPFIQKPFTLQDLTEKVRVVLRS